MDEGTEHTNNKTSQSTNEKFYLCRKFIQTQNPVFRNMFKSQPTVNPSNYQSIETLTGSNYQKWKQDLEISLGFLDYDYVLRGQELAADASAALRTKYAKWEKANHMSMLIMQKSMASSVRGSIPKFENAKQYYEAIAQRFKESEKAFKRCVRAHIMNLIDIGTKLQDMMVHLALNSLPKEFTSLEDTYIAPKEKLDIE
ncbi:unnamed protein product [Prunus armeniaca]